MVERSAGGGDRVSAARERAVEHIRRDGRGEHERGERRVTRAAAGHEERERQGQQNAGGRQRVRHGADGLSHDERSYLERAGHDARHPVPSVGEEDST